MLNLFISYFYSSEKYSEIVAVTAGAPALFNKSSSDDRPSPGICFCKYVEDVKAARSVRVWDRVPIKKTVKGLVLTSASPGLNTNNIPCPSYHFYSLLFTAELLHYRDAIRMPHS